MVLERQFASCFWLFVLLVSPLAAQAGLSRTQLGASSRETAPIELATGEDAVSEGVKSGLAKKFPGARIEVGSSIRWVRGSLPQNVKSVAIVEDSPRGEVRVLITGAPSRQIAEDDDTVPTPTTAEGWIGYSAWQPAFVAVRRVFPAERLGTTDFVEQEVNVAVAPYHDLRGLLVPPDTSIATLESRQTILEATPLLSSAVQRIPDLRRGDAVRIHLVSNGLTLSVPGIAEEPAYFKNRVKVMTDRTKRELIGELEADGVVRVGL